MPSPPVSEKAVERLREGVEVYVCPTHGVIEHPGDWEDPPSAGCWVPTYAEEPCGEDVVGPWRLMLAAGLQILYAEWREQLWREVEPLLNEVAEDFKRHGRHINTVYPGCAFGRLKDVLDPERAHRLAAVRTNPEQGDA